MCEWLNRRLDAGEPPFVLAGVAHHAITDIHPFADGNGRVARLFQTAALMRADVLPGRMFSFERYYAEDRPAYYGALRSVRQRAFNPDVWLDYVLRGLAEEHERVAATVADLVSLMPGGTVLLQLSVSQQRALTGLRLQGRREFARGDYEEAGNVGRSAAGDDLRRLATHGVLVVRGAGPNTRYSFPGAAPEGRRGRSARVGRPPKWTDTAIEAELKELLADKSEWPSYDSFRGREELTLCRGQQGGWRSPLAADRRLVVLEPR